MNKKESIEKIKSTLNELKELALSIRGKKEVEFNEFKSNDGTILVTNGELEIGAEVFTKDSDGNQKPLNDGEYACDGKKVTVSAGKIEKMEEIKEEDVVESPEDNANVNEEVVETEMKSEEVVEEVKEEVKAEEDIEDVTEEVIEEVSPEERIKNLEEAVSKILSVLDQVMTKTEETMSQNIELEKKVTELSEQPGDVSIEEKIQKTPIALSDVEMRIERFKKMAKSL